MDCLQKIFAPYFSLFYLLLLFASCSPVLYAPSSQNVPLLKQKGEVNFGGGYIGTEGADGLSLNFATAVDSSWAIAAAFNALSGGARSLNSWEGKGRYLEAAVGKFNTIADGPFLYEAFLGLGYGTARNKKPNNDVNGKFIKPYLQTSIGVRSKIVDLAFTPRIAVVNYVSNEVYVPDFPQEAIAASNYFDDKGSSFVLEPGITLRLGWNNVKFQAQYVYSTFNYKESDLWQYDKNILSFGLNFYVH
jgi:hypothetical protein